MIKCATSLLALLLLPLLTSCAQSQPEVRETVVSIEERIVPPRHVRLAPPVYDDAWGTAGVFVFGEKVIDLRNGHANISRPRMNSIWDCSTSDYWCLNGDIAFALPKRCRTFQVGETFTVRGTTMTVRDSYDPFPSHHGFQDPDQIRVYFFQADALNEDDEPVRVFFSYTGYLGVIELAAARTPLDEAVWERVFDPETQDFAPDYYIGRFGSFEPLAACRP